MFQPFFARRNKRAVSGSATVSRALFSALEVTVYSRRQAEPDGSLLLPLLLKRCQSQNGTNVSCGSFAKACGGPSLKKKR